MIRFVHSAVEWEIYYQPPKTNRARHYFVIEETGESSTSYTVKDPFGAPVGGKAEAEALDYFKTNRPTGAGWKWKEE